VKRTILILIVLFSQTLPVYSQYTHHSVFRFMNLPASARNAALGGNHPALFEANPLQFQSNPAYLDASNSLSLSLGYVNLFSDHNLIMAQSTIPIQKIGTLGLGLRYMGYGEMTSYDEIGTDEGTFAAYDMALSAGLGRSLGEHISYGVQLDLMYSAYQVYHSSGVGVSGGFRYTHPGDRYILAASFHHIGVQFSPYHETREELPVDVRVGVSVKPEYVPVRLSFSLIGLQEWDQRLPSDIDPPNLMQQLGRHLVVGSEFVFSSNLNVRLGYNHYYHQAYTQQDGLDAAGISYGFGLNLKRFNIDFSRNSYSDIGGTSHISIQTKF